VGVANEEFDGQDGHVRLTRTSNARFSRGAPNRLLEIVEICIAAKYSTLPPHLSDRSRSLSDSTTGTRELAIVSAYDLGKRLQFAGNLSVEGLRQRRSRELS